MATNDLIGINSTILFGEADPQQMQELARVTSGRMFDGRKDMITAFREAKGYN